MEEDRSMTNDRVRPAVLVSRRLPSAAMEMLTARADLDVWDGPGAMPRAELLARAAGKDGLVVLLTERIDGELLDAAGPQLRVVANYAVGYDNVDVAECSRRGIAVTNTPDVLTEATADLTWALLLACGRRIAEGDRWLRARRPWIWAPEFLLGVELWGRALGIVGFGRIGQAVARRAPGFGMTVLYTAAHRLEAARERELEVAWRDLDALLAEADVVSLHVPLRPETRHLIDAARLRRMKPGAILLNTARGPLVDEAALASALQAGELFAAGLDVFEREPEVHPDLLDCDNATLVPHLGSATVETRTAMGLRAAENLLAALDGRRPPHLVNDPGGPALRGQG